MIIFSVIAYNHLYGSELQPWDPALAYTDAQKTLDKNMPAAPQDLRFRRLGVRSVLNQEEPLNLRIEAWHMALEDKICSATGDLSLYDVKKVYAYYIAQTLQFAYLESQEHEYFSGSDMVIDDSYDNDDDRSDQDVDFYEDSSGSDT